MINWLDSGYERRPEYEGKPMASTDSVRTEAGPPVPFDPELAPALTFLREQIPSPPTVEMLPLLRGNVVPRLSDEELSLDGAFALREVEAPGPAGGPDVTLLVCLPTGATAPFGAIYYIHGGGMVIGNHRDRDLVDTLGWARELGLAVVSVDYRLAPENPHPAPVEDCYAGLAWTAANAGELGIDLARLVICGGSAGGGLAAGTVLIARDRGGPALAGQMLLCPMLDDRNDTPSAVQMAGAGIWDREANDFGWAALLGDERGGRDVSPYAAPARATDLSGLPPAYIDVGSAETFRDEAVEYASRLWRAGGQAELHVWSGGFHGFASLAPQAALSQSARSLRIPWLRRVLGG